MTDTTKLDELQPATEKMNWPIIWSGSAFIFALLAIVIVASIYGVRGVATGNSIKKTGAENDTELKTLLKQDGDILREYRELESGRYRIPIEQAMEILVEEKLESNRPKKSEKEKPVSRTVQPK